MSSFPQLWIRDRDMERHGRHMGPKVRLYNCDGDRGSPTVLAMACGEEVKEKAGGPKLVGCGVVPLERFGGDAFVC